MKLKIGDKEFGTVADEKLKATPIRPHIVRELIVERIEALVRRYIQTDVDRNRILNAMGLPLLNEKRKKK